MVDLLVNFVGVLLIGAVIWWFWFAGVKSKRPAAGRPIEIVMDGGVFTPARIEAPAGQALTLCFIRKDPSPCAEKVVFSDLQVSGDLTLGEPRDIEVTPAHPGEYEFSCRMGMYRGKLIAK